MNLVQEKRMRPVADWAPLALLGLLVLLGTTVAACSDGSVDPRTSDQQPGTLTATLASPNGPEGSALIEVDGRVTAVSPVTGQLFSAADSGSTRVLVILDEAGTVRFELTVSDMGLDREYTILEVAGPDDVLRSDLGGYTLEFTP